MNIHLILIYRQNMHDKLTVMVATTRESPLCRNECENRVVPFKEEKKKE